MGEIRTGETRPVPIEAIQFTNVTDLGDIVKFMGAHKVMYTQSWTPSIQVWKTNETPDKDAVFIRLTNWVVKHQGELKYRIFTEDEFNRIYKLNRKRHDG